MAAKKIKEVMIINRRSKKALQATGMDNGCVVEQAEPNGNPEQLWAVEKIDGVAKITNVKSGKVLDVMTEGVENGTWLQTWENVDSETQRWVIADITATYKKLVNARAAKVVDIAEMSDEDGAPAQIWEDVHGEGQQWKLVAPEKAVKPAKSKTVTKTVKSNSTAKKSTKK